MPSKPSLKYGSSWAPHPYQKRAFKHLIGQGAAALFLEPGLGKTSIGLYAIQHLIKAKQATRALVVAPLRVCENVWPEEVHKWKNFQSLTVAVLHGKNKEALLRSDADVCVINPEGLEWLFEATKVKKVGRNGKETVEVQVNMDRVREMGFDILVLDESTLFKNSRAIRFKIIKEVRRVFSYVWLFTGTPAANGIEDLWAQFYLMDGGLTLGRYITQFRRKYMVPDWSGYSWMPRQGAEDEVFKAIGKLALSMKAEDYLEMPQLIYNEVTVRLPDDVAKVYKAVEDDFFALLDDAKVSAGSKAAALTKCQQIANGAVFNTEDIVALQRKVGGKRKWTHLHDAKLDALEELSDELNGKPMLVAYTFEHDLARLKERFGGKSGEIPVIGQSKELDKKYIAQFSKGELRYLFVQPQSGARGLDGLQHGGHHVAWYSMTWDQELHDQLIRRLYRQGTKASHVFVHYIMAKGTVDRDMLLALRSKQKGHNALFEATKARRSGTC